MLRICAIRIKIQPRIHTLDHADYTTLTREHELDHTDHTDHTDNTDRECTCPERSISSTNR